MSDTALNAMKRTALVLFCLLLVVTLVLVFTRVVAARVPEQRATLEKLITDRTGLAVRFENVHFAWGLDGTSAVFTRVELTDPKSGRVRVVAPELRVEFDTWDFLRHQQFSLGHVTLSSPDIEIIGDADEVVASADSAPVVRGKARRAPSAPVNDEAALVRRVTAWAQLMPNGRLEVEGARVHLLQRGHSLADRVAARRTFTLSQAVISRGATTFNAYGTMLLAQDVGQSLFVSAKLENLSAKSPVSGELRVIARRVFLDKLPFDGLRGRGTLDAKIALRDGRVASGTWQASARELVIEGAQDDHAGPRFDHATVTGTLRRDAGDVLLELTDLQLTRGARLERAPRLLARLALEPGTTRIARTTVEANRMPFMVGELVAGVLAPQLAASLPASRGGWSATAGELHDLRFDSGERRRTPDAWTFSARMEGAELTRPADRARIAQLAARLQLDAHALTLEFDPAAAASIHLGIAAEPRPLAVSGRLTLTHAPAAALSLDGLTLKSGAATLAASGAWDDARRAKPLAITVADLDRALLADAWRLAQGAAPEPAVLGELAMVSITGGTVMLAPVRDADDTLEIDWRKSHGTLKLAALATAGKDAARLGDGRGTLAFASGAAQLRLTGGTVEDLALGAARLDWPAQGAPRLAATLSGSLDSTLLRPTLAAHGLENATGRITFDAEARGAQALREPGTWRISARLESAAVPLGKGLPPLEKLAGTLRYADGQLRALSLDGTWLGGPVGFEGRRAVRGPLALTMNGTADAAPLLRLLGADSTARHIAGQVAWTGNALRAAPDSPWQFSFATNLIGLGSDLPEPLGKPKARSLPITAELRFDAEGVRDFEIGGREFSVRGEMRAGSLRAHFELPGAEGDLRRGADAGAKTEISLDRLDTTRAPAVLAGMAAALSPKGELALDVADLRHADRSLGAVRARVARTDEGLAFSLDSAEPALHRISAQGTCRDADARCRAGFTADTTHFAALMRGVSLPADLPTEKLHANGELAWPMSNDDLAGALEAHFELETEGADATHQLVANATLANGELRLDDVQGTGPAPDQVFRGSGRIGLATRDYDFTVDYERMAAAAAVPTPARARHARAWNALRGSAARRGWTTEPEARRVQWHGYWDKAEIEPLPAP
jgi:hypothetical protein